MLFSALPDGRQMSQMGFGASSYWAKPNHPSDEAVVVAKLALEHGINFFDCSPSYADGEAERRLGLAIKGIKAENLILSSKFGAHKNRGGGVRKDFSSHLLNTSVEGSLKRLGVERIDMLFLHGPTVTDLTDDLLEHLIRLKEAGKVMWIGLLGHDREVLTLGLDMPFDAYMVLYHVIDRSCEEVIADIGQRNKILINTTILAQGVFSPKTFLPTSRRAAWYLLRILKNNPLFVRDYVRLTRFCASRDLEVLDFVIGFSLSLDGLHSGLTGTTQARNLIANAMALERLENRAYRVMIEGAVKEWQAAYG
jgi:D-threo-aldose 1-dehydrogenase